MHRLSGGLVLGFHGCDKATAERVLAGGSFLKSQNDYDWLGEGVYFWESNPHRGLEFAREKLEREKRRGQVRVVGAVIDLGLCLDLTTSAGIAQTRIAFSSLDETFKLSGSELPQNAEKLRRLDCAVINHLHWLRESQSADPVETIRGVFIEGGPAYPGARISLRPIFKSLCVISNVSRVFFVCRGM